MRVRQLLRTGLLLVLAGSSGCVRWDEVRPSGGGFVVQIPGSHPCNRSRGPAEFGALPGWLCSGGDATSYSRSFGTYLAYAYALPPGQDLKVVKRAVEADMIAGAQAERAEIVSTAERSLAGATWSESTLEGGATTSRPWRTAHLSLVRAEGVFIVTVTGPRDAWPEKGAERFLRSFQFVGRPGDVSPPSRS